MSLPAAAKALTHSAGSRQRVAPPRMRVLVAATAALLLLAGPGGALSADTISHAPNDTPSAACAPRTEPVPEGEATVVDSRPAPGAEERITEYTLDSPALGGQTKVNVMLPLGYDPDAQYPVLYLLHGAAGTHRDWQTQGAAVRIVDETTAAEDLPPFIVVMPSAGAFGFYSDWFGVDRDGHNLGPTPGWTTYHIDELIPWVDATFSTNPTRDGRAVAGLSMGGFGAMTYATRFPELWAAAGSFSGAVNPSYGYPGGNAFITAASAPFNGRGFDQCIWGEFSTQEVRWLTADPTYLAGNLHGAGTHLYVASGGGDQDRPEGLVTDPVEEAVYLMSRELVSQLQADGTPVTVDFYAEGGHSWNYWQRGLRQFLPQMAQAFADPPETPATFDLRSADPSFSAWGWDFTADRLVTEFTYLDDVGSDGLTVTGSGLLDVITAPLYEPGATLTLTGANSTSAVADADGRLAFSVDLGASHLTQQMAFDDLAATGWTTASVTIASG